MTNFANTEVKQVDVWANYPGTLSRGPIPLFCTPRATDSANAPNGVMRMEGDAIRAILQHCFDANPPEPVRTMGTKLSFSRIIEPARVVLDSANLTKCFIVAPKWIRDDYRTGRGAGQTPVMVEAGCTINALNRWLTAAGLALQTSGAGDGHRIAGCIATGTHGSAWSIGAVHDTVLGIHVVVAPDKALFIQSGSTPAFVPELADWFTRHTGIPTTHIAEDRAFHAVIVALGSMGIVFNVILEAAPLYRLQRKIVGLTWDDESLWDAITSLETGALHPDQADEPFHFDVLFHPYPPRSDVGAYATFMWKTPADASTVLLPNPIPPDISSDTMGLISRAVQRFGGVIPALSRSIVSGIIADELEARSTGDATIDYTPVIFGPTTLPPGSGASTEIVVNHDDIESTLKVLYRVFEEQAAQGNFLLGAMALRFVPGSNAWLGMNIHPMNCFIELPSIRNQDVLVIYEAVWNALEAANIPFTCHWGQLHGMNSRRLRTYFGTNIDEWRAARAALLDPIAQRVFAAPILAEVGL